MTDAGKFKISSSTALGTNDRFVIDGEGNVGIGTDSPAQKLDIVSSQYDGVRIADGDTDATTKKMRFLGRHYTNAEQNILYLDGSSGATVSQLYIGGGAGAFNAVTTLQFFTATTATTLQGTERMRINSSGNVGIGTTSPLSVLDVFKADGDASLSLTASSTDGTHYAWTTGTDLSDAGKFKISSSTALGTNDRFVIDGSGFVGIGIDSPASILHVKNTADSEIRIESGSINQAVLRFGDGAHRASIKSGTINDLRFTTNADGTEVMRMLADGNIGIGTTSPLSVLDVFKASGDASLSLTASSTDGTHYAWTTGTDLSDAGKFKISSSTVLGTNDRFVIDGSGNVGIGTASPERKLDVSSGQVVVAKFTGGSNAAIDIIGTGADINVATRFTGDTGWEIGLDGADSDKFKISNSADVNFSATKLTVQTNGNVGIGTTSPLSVLDVFKADGDASLSLTASSTDGTHYAWTTGTDLSDEGKFKISSSTALGTNDRFVIDGAGNVGIGIASPDELLHIYQGDSSQTAPIEAQLVVENNGDVGISILSGNTDNGDIIFGDAQASRQGRIRYNHDDDSMVFRAGGNDKMVIDSLGNIGIGTTTPLSILDVFKADGDASLSLTASSTDGTHYAWTTGTDLSDGGKFKISSSTALGTNDRFVIDGEGNVGIGTDSPGVKFHVSDSGQNILTLSRTGGGVNGDWIGTITTASGGAQGSLNLRPSANGDFIIANSAITANFMVDTSTGRIGIGTTTPTNKLTIYETADTGLGFSGVSGDNYKWTMGQDMTDAGKFKISSSTALGTNDRFVIDGAGNVGIGTATPDNPLVVALPAVSSNSYFKITSDTASTFNTYLGTTANNQYQWLTNLRYTGSAWTVDDATRGGWRMAEVVNTADNTSNFSLDYLNIGGGTPTTLFRVRGDGNVSIGTTTPLSILDVFKADGDASLSLTASSTDGTHYAWTTGTDLSDGGKFKISSSTALGTNDRFVIDGEGNVGIGTASPSDFLEIEGNLAGEGLYLDSSSGVSIRMDRGYITNNVSFRLLTAGVEKWAIGNKSKSNEQLEFYSNNSSTASVVFDESGNVGIGTTSPLSVLDVFKADGDASLSLTASSTDGTQYAWTTGTDLSDAGKFKISSSTALGTNDRFVIDGSGNVGIGTDSPLSKLSILTTNTTVYTGTWSGSTNHYDPDSSDALFLYNNDGTGDFSNIFMRAGNSAFGTGRISLLKSSSSVGDFTFSLRNGSSMDEKMRITGAGNVGIGTTTPNNLLTLYETTDTGLGFSGASGDNYKWTMGQDMTDAGKFKISSSTALGTNDRFVIDGSGNVGIGTDSPTKKLSIEGGLKVGYTTDTYDGSFVSFYRNNQTISSFSNSAGELHIRGQNNKSLYFEDDTGVGMVIKDGGNIGIGTTSPTHKLTVSGAFCVDNLAGGCNGAGITNGDIYYNAAHASYTDIAEKYPSNEELNAGEIVSLDNELAESTGKPYVKKGTSNNDKIIGIVSTNPGLILGDGYGNSDDYSIALAGRVPVKVNLEGGDIEIGDRIALSSTAGTGKKSTNSGQTVGIALESYDGSGGDTIMVFVENEKTFATDEFMIDENGNIGIGTSTPEYKMHIIGDVAATSFVNISTKTSKKDISYLNEEDDGEVLTKIKGMSVARYRYNIENETDPLRLGLIAEEAPSEILASTGKGVDIYKLSTFILAGVKAQQKQIDAIEMRVVDLEMRVGEGGGVSVEGVLAYFEGLGVRLTAGIAYFKDVVVERLTVGSAEKPSGVTLYNPNGEPYCVKVDISGELVSEAGECSASQIDADDTQINADTEAPTILIQGNNPAEIEIGASYVDLGVIAQDTNGNDLSITILLNGATTTDISLDTSTSTTYTITYSATDNDGLSAEAERIVIVGNPADSQIDADGTPINADDEVSQSETSSDEDAGLPRSEELAKTDEDEVVPVITLNGEVNIEIELNSVYEDEGSIAEDDIDGDITDSIVVSGEVDTLIAGTYTISYNVSDNAGNDAEEVVRTVVVKSAELEIE
ncbi:immunoglobulin-like domain-containing protein [Patescibacteria group bacterium]